MDAFQAEQAYYEICTTAPDEWADIVNQQLQAFGGDLSYITQLGSHYLSHLVIPCKQAVRLRLPFIDIPLFEVRNPGGQRTPQDTVHPTPNLRRIDEIEALLKAAKSSQSALKDLASFRSVH